MKRQVDWKNTSLPTVSEYFPATKFLKVLENDGDEKQKQFGYFVLNNLSAPSPKHVLAADQKQPSVLVVNNPSDQWTYTLGPKDKLLNIKNQIQHDVLPVNNSSTQQTFSSIPNGFLANDSDEKQKRADVLLVNNHPSGSTNHVLANDNDEKQKQTDVLLVNNHPSGSTNHVLANDNDDKQKQADDLLVNNHSSSPNHVLVNENDEKQKQTDVLLVNNHPSGSPNHFLANDSGEKQKQPGVLPVNNPSIQWTLSSSLNNVLANHNDEKRKQPGVLSVNNPSIQWIFSPSLNHFLANDNDEIQNQPGVLPVNNLSTQWAFSPGLNHFLANNNDGKQKHPDVFPVNNPSTQWTFSPSLNHVLANSYDEKQKQLGVLPVSNPFAQWNSTPSPNHVLTNDEKKKQPCWSAINPNVQWHFTPSPKHILLNNNEGKPKQPSDLVVCNPSTQRTSTFSPSQAPENCNDEKQQQSDDPVVINLNAQWTFSPNPKQVRLLLAAKWDSEVLNGILPPSVGLNRLSHDFYDVPCEELAKALLGKVLVRCLDDGTLIKGRIVETESYLGGIDKASHSYNGKITIRNTPMYLKPGTIYAYFTYGLYYCFNISSRGPGAAVLVRALEPIEGIDYMQMQRSTMKKMVTIEKLGQDSKPKWKLHELCNGPSKLCRCLNISTELCNKRDLCIWDGMWIESDSISESVKTNPIISSARIGIDYSGAEWASKPLRFYLLGFRSVSKLDKKAEQAFIHN